MIFQSLRRTARAARDHLASRHERPPILLRLRDAGLARVATYAAVVVAAVAIAVVGVTVFVRGTAAITAVDRAAQARLTAAYHTIQAASSSTHLPNAATAASLLRHESPAVVDGSCADARGDRVVVGSESGPDAHLYLYAGGSHGKVWLLAAGPDRAERLSRLASCVAVHAVERVMLASSDITDATRAVPALTDGRPPTDSSVGVWEVTQNLAASDSIARAFASTPDGSRNQTGGTKIPHDTSFVRFYSSNPLTNALNTAIATAATVGVTPGAVYSVGVVVRSDGHPDLRLADADPSGAPLAVPTSATPLGHHAIWLTATFTASKSQRRVRTFAIVVDRWNDANYLDVGRVQLLRGTDATPFARYLGYRAPGRIQMPAAGVVSAERSWVAFRVRLGWRAGAGPPSYPRFFSWGRQDVPGRQSIDVFYEAASRRFGVGAYIGGEPAGTAWTQPLRFPAGTTVTVVATWERNALSISVGGRPFTRASRPRVAAMSAFPTFDVMGRSDGSTQTQVDGDILWFAAGDGQFSKDDLAATAALGDADPTPGDFTSRAQPRLTWSADNTTALTAR
jgi:hypothetical protein